MRRSRIFNTFVVLAVTTMLAACTGGKRHANDGDIADSAESCIIVDKIEKAENGLVKVKGRLWGNTKHRNFYSPNRQMVTIFLDKNRKVFPGDTLRFNLD